MNSHLWYVAGNPAKHLESKSSRLVKGLGPNATRDEGWWMCIGLDFAKKLLRRNLIGFKGWQLYSRWKTGCCYIGTSEWGVLSCAKMTCTRLFHYLWKGQGDEEGRPHIFYFEHLPVVQSILHFGAHSLGSTFFWFLLSFFTPLCLDPAEPPIASGKWGLCSPGTTCVAQGCCPCWDMAPQLGLVNFCCYFLTVLGKIVSVFSRKYVQFLNLHL